MVFTRRPTTRPGLVHLHRRRRQRRHLHRHRHGQRGRGQRRTGRVELDDHRRRRVPRHAAGTERPTDVDGNPLTITVTGLPTVGTVTLADGTPVTNGQVLTARSSPAWQFDAPADLAAATTGSPMGVRWHDDRQRGNDHQRHAGQRRADCAGKRLHGRRGRGSRQWRRHGDRCRRGCDVHLRAQRRRACWPDLQQQRQLQLQPGQRGLPVARRRPADHHHRALHSDRQRRCDFHGQPGDHRHGHNDAPVANADTAAASEDNADDQPGHAAGQRHRHRQAAPR